MPRRPGGDPRAAFDAHSMKGAAAALRAGDLVRVCERLERIAKRLPDQHESDATPRALVADVAAKIRALAADAAELRRVSTFPVAHAATRHGEALATKLGALVLVAARAFRLSVEVRAEMETVRSGGDDARVGSAVASLKRGDVFSRNSRASTKPRRRREKRLSRDVRGGEGVARHGERRRGDGRARTRARRARAVARDSRRRRVELARQRSETRRVSTRARGVRVGRVGRPRIRDAGRGARFGIGGIEQGIEQGIGNIGNVGNIGKNIGNVGIGALGARVRATRDGETRVPRGSRGTRGGGRDGGEMESRVGSQTRERIREFRRAETELPRVDVVSISAGRLYAVKCTAAVADADAKDRDGRRDEDDDDDDDDGYGKPNDGRRRALRFTRWIR